MWPDLVEIKNKKGQNILHVAAKAENNYVVRYMLKECGNPVVVEKLVNSKDVDGNTPLHLASMRNHCSVLLSLTTDKRSDLRFLNNVKLTTRDVAGECRSSPTVMLLGDAILKIARVPRNRGEDIRSAREGAEWVMDKINTRLIVAPVTFAAGFILPGGYNAFSDPHPGTATILHQGLFQLFVVSNTLAMSSSVHAVAILLWGSTSNFYIADTAYYVAGPILLMSLTCMSVAFMAAVIVAVRKLSWLALLVPSIALAHLVSGFSSLGILPRGLLGVWGPFSLCLWAMWPYRGREIDALAAIGQS